MQIKYYLLEEGSALKETILKKSLILDQENKMRNELINVIRDLETKESQLLIETALQEISLN